MLANTFNLLNMPESFLFRADASTSIGTGHVMRCLALAQAAQDEGHSTTFLMNGLTDRVKENNCEVVELKSERGSFSDAKETSDLAKKLNAKCIVDGYAFADEYQYALKQSGARFMLIDDYGQATSYSADMILNQNSYAESLRDIYEKRSSGSELLLGSKYTMLRREFRDIDPNPSVPIKAKSILVTLGGGDPDNVTLRVVKLLSQIEDIEATIVVGGMNLHLNDIKVSAKDMNVLTDVHDMPSLISEAELAITAGGSTTYEMAYMGVPTVAITIANNQQPVVADLGERGVVESIGRPDEWSDDDLLTIVRGLINNQSKRKEMSDNGRMLIDGKGAERVLEKLLKFV
ncbi:TPA: UDP-2,4-diacetamido-2,4,6-trideoxy-beta-L-altropyranose hydrolase [Candidatus Peribacteria bacterium]|jgi:UDP-2,4-diacetamido-2,4,6-trideoxy-beta-L-altropyranose hydrolase|nr:UDP-2,4-diacetamido-2,4,6-trideoxy-beta-L-altropyranose hydrolase [Candidatus Peribacteria bacterium]|tara:strand:+ start:6622 stop:7662 length:1041 start_codon:yes stop_codon:yes gene_type:complete